MTQKTIQISPPQDLYKDYLKSINGIDFTRREIDIIACIMGGRAAKKIASFFSISPKTVETHIHNIMLKLGCGSRERVIDYFERSSKHRLLKIHYTYLMLNLAFEKSLKEVSLLTINQVTSCVIYQDTEKIDKTPLVQQLKKHFNIANINVSLINNKEQNLKSSSSINSVLPENPNKLPQDRDINPKINLLFETQNKQHSILISLIGKIVHAYDESQTVVQVDLSDQENYCHIVFEILAIIYPPIDLNSIRSHFHSYCREIYGSAITILNNAKNDDYVKSNKGIIVNTNDMSRKKWVLSLGLLIFSISLFMYQYIVNKNILVKYTSQSTKDWVSVYETHVKESISLSEFYQLRGNSLDIYRAKEMIAKVEQLSPHLEKDIEIIQERISSIRENLFVLEPFNYLLKNKLIEKLQKQEIRLTIALSFNVLCKLMDKEDFTDAINEIETRVIKQIDTELEKNNEQHMALLKKWRAIAMNINAVAKRKHIEKTVSDKKTYKSMLANIYNDLSISSQDYDPFNHNTHLHSHYIKMLLAQEESDLNEKNKLELAAEKHLAFCSDKAPKEPLVIGAQAIHYAQKNEYNKAVVAFNSALDLQPNNVSILHNRSELYLNLGSKNNNGTHYYKAYIDATKADQLKPNDCNIIKLIVWSSIHVKGCKEARTKYEKTYLPLCIDERNVWDDVSAVRNNSSKFLENKLNSYCSNKET